MDLQQIFGERLLCLLEENNITQGDFADKMDCSRQSINFYILGKRSPDISLAAKMAQHLGVSCDYLVGFSNFRNDKEANLTASNIGLSEDSMKFFGGLKMMSEGKLQTDKVKLESLGLDYENEVLPYNMCHAQTTLNLLNTIISHDSFGVLLQYIKRYGDIRNGHDEIAILKDFMFDIQSPLTEKHFGSKEENIQMMQEFCLHVITKYFDNIVRDITK